MLNVHEGGCLCGGVRYRTTAKPMRVTVCHCTFCQKLTGSAYLRRTHLRREDIAVSPAPLQKRMITVRTRATSGSR